MKLLCRNCFSDYFANWLAAYPICGVFVHGLTYVPILRQVDWIAGGILSLIMAYVTIFLILQLLAFVPLDVVQNQFGEHSFARFIVERTPFLTNKMYELWVTNILN